MCVCAYLYPIFVCVSVYESVAPHGSSLTVSPCLFSLREKLVCFKVTLPRIVQKKLYKENLHRSFDLKVPHACVTLTKNHSSIHILSPSRSLSLVTFWIWSSNSPEKARPNAHHHPAADVHEHAVTCLDAIVQKAAESCFKSLENRIKKACWVFTSKMRVTFHQRVASCQTLATL